MALGARLSGTLDAAGALVLAIAHVQREAERLAERAVAAATASVAVPVTAPPRAGSDPENAARNARPLALRDRRLTPDERVHLAEVAEAMGIGAGREAERESEVAP